MPAPEGPKVLYILGAGRSGSTLLGQVLGEAKGAVYAGELRLMWRRLVLGNGRCGCDRPLTECDRWRGIFDAMDLDLDSRDDLQRLARLQREVGRHRNVPNLLARNERTVNGSKLADYVELQSRLLRAISEMNGASVIIDSSKFPADAAILPLVPGIQPIFVHLVRDPRAVAFSWQREKKAGGNGEARPKRLTLRSANVWTFLNAGAEAVRIRYRRRYPQVRVRYEDFVADLRASLSDIHAQTAVPLPEVEEGGREIELSVHHSAGGNQGRFLTGIIPIREDAAWMQRLSKRDRRKVAAATLPLLLRYGYRVRLGNGASG